MSKNLQKRSELQEVTDVNLSQRSIVTVTLNPAIDQTVSIPNFSPGEVNRVAHSQSDPGGKGVNVASFLSDVGFLVTVTGFLGLENDRIFERLFARKNIEDRFVRIAGKTRTGIKIVDPVRQETTDINFPGQTPTRSDIEQLFAILQDLTKDHTWFVLSGSIPAGVPASIYRDLVQTLQDCNLILDTSGEGFRQAVLEGPTIIKPNIDELQDFVGHPLETQTAILLAARELMQYGIQCVVVSMGKQGAIFVEDEQAVLAIPPHVEVKSTVGAGDAMVSGIVAGKLSGLSLGDTARMATAFSVNAISRIGAQLPSTESILETMQQIAVQVL